MRQRKGTGRQRGARQAELVRGSRLAEIVSHRSLERFVQRKDEAPIRADLCRLALGLARSLREEFPAEPEVMGLLALISSARRCRAARLDASGAPVALPDQDRSRWDRDAIREGTALLDEALRVGLPGRFQLEAAIAATHCLAPTADETNWMEIAGLYALFEQVHPSPGVRVNRAFAVARARGAAEGLALIDEGDAAGYPYVHLVRGALLEELGRDDAAIDALERATREARNAHEANQIQERIERIRERVRT